MGEAAAKTAVIAVRRESPSITVELPLASYFFDLPRA
jgi:hypothetical protein